MADIAPLLPLRYDLERLTRLGETLADVVAPPYDVIDAAQRAELAAREPHNVVHLILPQAERAEQERDPDAKYAHAAKLLAAWRSERVLVRDEEPAFYRYDQTFAPPGGGARRTRRGFLALVKLVPFSAGVVLPHERTLSGPKEDRLKLFRATRTNLSPGFMLYKDPQRALDAALARAETLTELTTSDGVEHSLAKVRDREAIHAIVAGVARSSLLIADGHHRYETALRYAQETDAAVGGAPGDAEHKWFMVFLANGDDPELVVFPTHRHVHALPSFDYAATIKRAEGLFTARRLGDGASAEAALDALQAAGSGSFAACGRGRRGHGPDVESGSRPRDPRDARSAAARLAAHRRRASALRVARGRARHHARSAGGEDEPLVPAGRHSGARSASERIERIERRERRERDRRRALPDGGDARGRRARRRRGRARDAPEEHILLSEGPHGAHDPHARARPPRRVGLKSSPKPRLTTEREEGPTKIRALAALSLASPWAHV